MKRLIIVLFIISNVLVSTASPQDMAVPVDLQYALFLKIISFERTLLNKNNDSLVIGILYQSRYSTSRNTKDEFIKTMLDHPAKDIKGNPIEYVLIDAMNEDISESITANKVNILYLTPVRALDIEKIAETCRNHNILSLSGVPEYCERGLSVGIGQKGAKPEIIINLNAARAEGADFSSQLLKLAKIL